jgi:acetyl esterase/lipase
MLKPLPKIPTELRELMAEFGPQWSIDRTQKIQTMIDRYSEVLKQLPKDNVDVRRDVPYGPSPRQRFDLYKPNDRLTKRAAVLFVHGGAFMDGHRNRTEEIYSNVSYYLARNGVAAMNIGYRLGDEAPYPAGSDDIGAVVSWTHSHAAEIGIDHSRIFLMGHSAGAAHAGSYAYDKRCHPIEGPGLAGLIVVSGRVRAETRPENPNAKKVIAYYGTDDPQILETLSPVSHVGPESVPTFVAWGEYENPLLDVHCAELVYRLSAAKKRSPPVVWLRGHNHTSAIAHIGTADEMLGHAILDFITNPR